MNFWTGFACGIFAMALFSAAINLLIVWIGYRNLKRKLREGQ